MNDGERKIVFGPINTPVIPIQTSCPGSPLSDAVNKAHRDGWEGAAAWLTQHPNATVKELIDAYPYL